MRFQVANFFIFTDKTKNFLSLILCTTDFLPSSIAFGRTFLFVDFIKLVHLLHHSSQFCQLFWSRPLILHLEIFEDLVLQI